MIIANWKKSDRPGKRKGTFDLTMPSGLTLLQCALIEGENGLFIGLPQRTYVKDGDTKYVPTVEIKDRDTSKKFSLQVIEALKKGMYIE